MNQKIKNIPVICNGHTRPVNSICFNNDFSDVALLLSCSKDSKAMLRDAYTGDWIGTFHGHKGCVWCCRFNMDATLVATGSADFSANIWNVEDGKIIAELPHEHIVRALDFGYTSDNSLVITADGKNQINFFDLAVFTKNLQVGTVKKLEILTKEKKFLTLSENKSLCLWDLTALADNKPAIMFRYNLESSPMDMRLQFSKNSPLVKLLISDYKQAQFITFDLRKPSSDEMLNAVTKKIVETKSPITSLAMHPSTDEFILCGCEDGIIYRIKTDTSEELDACKGHFGAVHCVDFASSDGRLFASGSEDGTVRLWQTSPGEDFGLWKLQIPNSESAIVIGDSNSKTVS